ncbi:hypothetical protein BHE74_00020953 [Ensete ventricosum]|nr:hypothetical protein GW17_00037613 [Ensete ventricosum]RWW71315.1 hypothetical protein BHE74_00020953 [Ensete ventricosum]
MGKERNLLSYSSSSPQIPRAVAMGSLRFPVSLPRPPKPPRGSAGTTSFRLAATAIGAGIGFAVGFSLESAADTSGSRRKPWSRASPIWASLSLAEGPTGTSVEPRTGAAFPTVLDGGRRLTGIGLRKTSVLGLKNIDVYAFGNFSEESIDSKLMILVFAVSGKEVGEIQSKLLCKSVLDLYFGEDPFDKRAKEDIQSGLASILQERSD